MKPAGSQDCESIDLPTRLCQVAELIARGYSDKQIAQELQLSPRTVHRHVVRLLERLGVENRAAAAAVWARSTIERGGGDEQDAERPTKPGGDGAAEAGGSDWAPARRTARLGGGHGLGE